MPKSLCQDVNAYIERDVCVCVRERERERERKKESKKERQKKEKEKERISLDSNIVLGRNEKLSPH